MNKESVGIINRLRAILEDSSYYLGKHCRYCGQALDLSPVEKFKEDLRTMNKTMKEISLGS